CFIFFVLFFFFFFSSRRRHTRWPRDWSSDVCSSDLAMVTALLLGCLLIPIWVFAPNLPLILAGGFLMQFMVQGAWGVIPAHINELSPDTLRGFFPGFAYQLGVLIASGSAYFEARMAHF